MMIFRKICNSGFFLYLYYLIFLICSILSDIKTRHLPGGAEYNYKTKPKRTQLVPQMRWGRKRVVEQVQYGH